MYEMRRKPEPILLQTQGIFNLPHHVGMVWEGLGFDDVVSYMQREMDCSAAKCYSSNGDSNPEPVTPRFNQLS